MKLISFILIFLTSSFAFASDVDKSISQKSVEIFDGLCFRNYGDFENIKYLMELEKSKKIPDELLKADPVLRNSGGEAFVYNYEGAKFIVSYSTDACSIVSNDFEASETLELFKSYFDVEKVYENDAGMQVSVLYKLLGSSSISDALVTFTYTKESTGIKFGNIGIVSGEAIRKARS